METEKDPFRGQIVRKLLVFALPLVVAYAAVKFTSQPNHKVNMVALCVDLMLLAISGTLVHYWRRRWTSLHTTKESSDKHNSAIISAACLIPAALIALAIFTLGGAEPVLRAVKLIPASVSSADLVGMAWLAVAIVAYAISVRTGMAWNIWEPTVMKEKIFGFSRKERSSGASKPSREQKKLIKEMRKKNAGQPQVVHQATPLPRQAPPPPRQPVMPRGDEDDEPGFPVGGFEGGRPSFGSG